MDKIELILNVFEGFRMNPLSTDQYEVIGKQILRDKIGVFVCQNKPILFSIMGFPMKSTNTVHKVLGTLPDAAEEATLANFARFNQCIKQVYEPGVIITIASDGFAFNDVLGVNESCVDAYQEVSTDMIGDAPVTILNLRDFYDRNTTILNLQAKLNAQFGITEEELTRRILFDADVNTLYRGMLRFMEEEVAWQPFPSKNQQAKKAKILTREMMLRNEAYSGLVRSQLGDHIRLSMHPSINNGVKYSFELIPTARYSAWHSTLLVNADGNHTTIHRSDAEQTGHELIFKDGRPYNFLATA